jgi:hypothetical protein
MQLGIHKPFREDGEGNYDGVTQRSDDPKVNPNWRKPFQAQATENGCLRAIGYFATGLEAAVGLRRFRPQARHPCLANFPVDRPTASGEFNPRPSLETTSPQSKAARELDLERMRTPLSSTQFITCQSSSLSKTT